MILQKPICHGKVQRETCPVKAILDSQLLTSMHQCAFLKKSLALGWCAGYHKEAAVWLDLFCSLVAGELLEDNPASYSH